MSADSAVLSEITKAFAAAPRPEHFTNFTHCPECAEHDQTLIDHTPDTISLDQLGFPGWDPICFISVPGYLYYFPGLSRLALEHTDDYLDQFLFSLNHERVEAMTPMQRAAVLTLLEFIQKKSFSHEWNDVLQRQIKRFKQSLT